VSLSEEAPLERKHQKGVPHYISDYFTAIDSSSVKPGRHRYAAYHNKHW